jgi:hypothetical protein
MFGIREAAVFAPMGVPRAERRRRRQECRRRSHAENE